MTAIQCKDFIDEEIWTEFTDEDRFIKSIIVSPRGKSSFRCIQVFSRVLKRQSNGTNLFYCFQLLS